MSAPNPGEAGVRLWRKPDGRTFQSKQANDETEWVALPLTAHEALVARVARLEAACEAAESALVGACGYPATHSVVVTIRAALAPQGGGAP